MTALDLGTATRTLTPPASAFASIPYGDATLSPVSGTITPTTWEGIAALPATASWATDNTLQSDTPFSIPQDTAIFVAIGGLATGSSNWEVLWHYSGYDLGINDEYLVYANGGNGASAGSSYALPTPIQPTDLVVWCIASNSVELRVLNSLDGTLRLVSAAQAASPSDTFDVNLNGADANILGIWQFDGVVVNETDAIDTMAAIAASLPGTATNFITAAGGWGIGGSGTAVNSDGLDIPAEPAPLSPGGTQTPPAIPPLVVPDDVDDVVIRRISKTWDAPTLNAEGFPVDWQPTSVVDEDYARMQIVVEGVDVTWINGVPTPLPAYSRTSPFGSYSAQIVLPQITTFQPLPAWAKKGANVQVQLIRISDSAVIETFTGVAIKAGRREDNREFSLLCHGVVFVADLQSRLPGFTSAPRDIGHVIADVLNDATSRRYDTVARVTTGLQTSVLGGWEPTLSGFVQTLLASAVTGGRQWTVRCDDRSPVIVKKDVTTVHHTIRAGQEGIEVDLEDDAAESPNLIYGEGINPDGGRWRNAKYPNWKPDDTPDYPYDPPDTSIKVGTRDSNTDTGTGVSVWQAKAGQPVTGYFSISDRAALIRLQRRSGITVDGFLGPQSWASTFNTGANTGTLDGAFIAPLAASPEVMPRLYGPDGDDLGANPAYDPNVVVVDRHINFGSGVRKSEAVKNAEEVLARDSGDGWAGTITFVLDPPTASKYELREGQNIRVLGWGDDSPLLHIAAVDSTPEEDGSPVRCTVDERARDYPTLDAIRARERDAVDPARIAFRRITKGSVGSDWITYDAESPAGIMPRHAVYGGLWDVRQIPLGSYGSVARTIFRTSSPATAFSMGVFMKPLTAADLQSLIGNPLAEGLTDDPWQIHGDALKAMGLAASWGWEAQPAGYHPRQKTNPNGISDAVVTGRLEDESSWEYATQRAPWIWVATIADASCNVEGRFYGGTF